MGQSHIEAAGGIVLRGTRVAVVQRRKDRCWVLPKGKLTRGETAVAAARREVTEETGHDVVVHEFIGAISYDTPTAPKIVQFWRMEAADAATRPLMKDIRAVEWLPLKEAVKRLSLPREQLFLRNVGPLVQSARRAEAVRANEAGDAVSREAVAARNAASERLAGKSFLDVFRTSLRQLRLLPKPRPTRGASGQSARN